MQLDQHVLPAVLENIPQIRLINQAADKWLKKVADDIDAVESDEQINSSTERGIARREKILGITPLDTDSLEDRRYRVLTQWYSSYPYTERNLRNRLDTLIGEGNYTMGITPTKVSVRVGLQRKKQIDAVRILLEKIVPLHIVLDVDLLYNTYGKYDGTWAHNKMAKYTQSDLREKDMENG